MEEQTAPDEESQTRPPVALDAGVEAPKCVGRYVVVGTLGQGGMGVVYLARDPDLDRDVALKVVRPGWNRGSARARDRFKREAQSLAHLAHPNVVAVFDAGVERDMLFFAMERVRGRSLREWLAAAPRSEAEILRVFTAAGRALEAAHAQGIVHRDFKPQNVMIGDGDDVKVLDFGLAGLIEGGESSSWDGAPVEKDDAPLREAMTMLLTRTGIVMGTPAYLAPEQYRRQKLDGRADEFAFCVALYEALAGRRPFAGRTLGAIQEAVTLGRMEPPERGRTISARVLAAIRRGLAPAPEDRFPTMTALLDALAVKRRARWPFVALGVAATGAAAILYMSDPPAIGCEDSRARADQVWGDARRAEVRAGAAASGLSYAEATAGRVEPLVDAWVESWTAAYDEACAASPPDDVAMICLRGRLHELDDFVTRLVVADRTAFQSAVRKASTLPAAARCVEPESVARPDATAVAALESVQELIVKTRELSSAGEYEDAERTAATAVSNARAVGWAPVIAEALVEEAFVKGQRAEPAAAERAYVEAYEIASSAGDHALALRAARGLVFAIGVEQARFDEALDWGRHGEAALARYGPDPVGEAALLSNIGSVLGDKGDFEAAAERHLRALELETEALGADHLTLAGTHLNVAYALSFSTRRDEALAHTAKAVEILEGALGPDHPDLATALTAHAHRLADDERFTEALPLFTRAADILRAALGPDHPDVAAALIGAGDTRFDLGESEAALELLREGLAIRRRNVKTSGDERPVARALEHLARVLTAMGRNEEAVAAHREAIAIEERVLGADHRDVVASLNNLATTLRELGRNAEAIETYERALAAFERLEHRTERLHAVLLDNLARAYHGAKRWDEATAAYAKARPLVIAVFGADSPHAKELDVGAKNCAAHQL